MVNATDLFNLSAGKIFLRLFLPRISSAPDKREIPTASSEAFKDRSAFDATPRKAGSEQPTGSDEVARIR